MAYFFRLIAALVLSAFSLTVYAQTCTQYRVYKAATGNPVTYTSWATTKAAVCAEWVVYKKSGDATLANNWAMGKKAVISEGVAGDGLSCYIDYVTTEICCGGTPAGTTGAHVQGPFFTQQGDCADKCIPKLGHSAGRWDYNTGVSTAGPSPAMADRFLCDKEGTNAWGCVVLLDPDFGFASADGKWMHSGPAKYTGNQCDPNVSGDGLAPSGSISENSTSTVSTNTCPAGYFKGTVNGVAQCVPPAPGSPTVTDSTKSSSTTSTSGTGGGTTTSTITTSCSGDGSCTQTSTTVTNNGSGPVTTTTTTKVSEADFCKDNPTSPQCSESGFAGSCTQGFTCTGDAALCAVARASNEQKCILDRSSPEKTLYEASVASGTSTTGLSTETIALGPSSFSQANMLNASAQCIADKTVTVAGHTVVLPFSSICGHLAMLGNLLMAVAFLLAIRIVSRG